MKLQLGKPDVIADPLDDFLSALTVAGASENTMKLYRTAISDFLSFVKKDPRQVNVSDLNRWVADILKREGRTAKPLPEFEKRRLTSSPH